jgi:hypothetical protein
MSRYIVYPCKLPLPLLPSQGEGEEHHIGRTTVCPYTRIYPQGVGGGGLPEGARGGGQTGCCHNPGLPAAPAYAMIWNVI